MRAPPPASPYCMAAPTLPPSRKVSPVGVAMRPLKRRFAGHVNYRARAPHRDKPLRFAKKKKGRRGMAAQENGRRGVAACRSRQGGTRRRGEVSTTVIRRHLTRCGWQGLSGRTLVLGRAKPCSWLRGSWRGYLEATSGAAGGSGRYQVGRSLGQWLLWLLLGACAHSKARSMGTAAVRPPPTLTLSCGR